MLGLMSTDGAADGEVRLGLSRWLFWNHGRHVLLLAAWLAALRALSSSESGRRRLFSGRVEA